MTRSSKRPWLVAAGTFMMLFTGIGLNTSGLSLFYIPVTEELGFTQSAFTLYFTIFSLTWMISMALIGRLLKKHMNRIRLYLIISGVITMLCYIGYGASSRLWEFYAISVIRGIAGAAFSSVPVAMLINNWFREKRVVATSIAFTGSGFGGLFYTQLSRILITNCGWRAAYSWLGAAALITLIIAAVLVLPDPESVGEQPYGETGDADIQQGKASVSFKDAIRTPSFWIVSVMLGIGSLCVMGAYQFVSSALVIDCGFSGTMASNAYSLALILSCGGKLIFGWVYDKHGDYVAITYISVTLIMSFIMLYICSSPVHAFAFSIFSGLGNMTSTVLPSSVITRLYGTEEFGSIFGIVNMFCAAGIAIGPYITSAIFDGTMTYRPAWLVFIATTLVSMLSLMVLIRSIQKRR